MARSPRFDPIGALLRGADASNLVTFFQAVEEGISSDFIDSNRSVPAEPDEMPAIAARGHVRHMLHGRTLKRAAKSADLNYETGRTAPATWSFPVISIGAYSITIAIVDRITSRNVKRIRSRARYLKQLVSQNDVADPQGTLFLGEGKVTRLVPRGSVGAVIAIQPSEIAPDRPSYVGFWIPRPNLRKTFYRIKLEELVSLLRERVAAKTPKKAMTTERKKLVRKPIIKKPRERKTGEE